MKSMGYWGAHGQLGGFEGEVPEACGKVFDGIQGFLGGAGGKELACQCRKHKNNVGWTPGSGRSSGGGNGNPLQYSCLEYSMDRGAWQARVHRVAKSWTGLK